LSKKDTSKIELALSKRYDYPEWAFFTQIGGENRIIDAIAINMWPSRKYEIHGFEIKVSRNDWLHELKTPSKADFFVGQCDKFSIVSIDGLVKKDELPEDWGLIVLRKSRLFTVVRAKKTYRATPSRRFYTNLIRQSFEKNGISGLIYEAETRGWERAKKEEKRHTQWRLDQLNEKVKVLKLLSDKGIHLQNMNEREINELIPYFNFAKAMGEWGLSGRYENLRNSAKRLLDSIDKELENFKELKKK